MATPNNIKLPAAALRHDRVEDLQAALRIPNITPPTLIISEHVTPSEEKYTRNGIVRDVNVVVKNTPFNLIISLKNSRLPTGQTIDFFHMTLDLILLYDNDSPGDKPVDYLKTKPVDFKPMIDPKGETATIEVKIKTLTSQHEDSFFKAKIVALDPRTGKEFNPSLFCYSEPIKVISKPEQLKKRKTAKKRTLTDMLVETINRIERTQADQSRMITQLLEARYQQPVPAHHMPAPPSPMASPTMGRTRDLLWSDVNSAHKLHEENIHASSSVDFEAVFANFITTFQNLPPEEKPSKVRRLMRAASTQDAERLAELIDLFTAEGLQQGIGSDLSGSAAAMSGCQCATCPHKAELLKIDEFYKEFLSTPGSNSGPSFS